MLSRKNRRRKDTGPMFPFGEIMLPVIGLVALGILILSVKMFFLPSGDDKLYQNIPQKNGDSEIARVIEEKKNVDVSAKPETDNVHNSPSQERTDSVAVPVSDNVPSGTEIENRDKTSEETQINNNDNSRDTSANGTPTSSRKVDQNSSWGVQIGSFKETDAADSLSEQAKQKGYSVITQQAEVKGATYHRVIVLAGNSQGNASEMENKLKSDGFPTFVKRIR